MNHNEALVLYKKMLLIRITDEEIAARYPNGEMRTPTHFSIGQEAISAGVCKNLTKKDYVFASHRSHAAYLSKDGNLKEMIFELFGRKGGACKGIGGSAHLSSPQNNMFSAPILGGMIPVAVGVAFSFKMDKKRNVAIVFMGDAAIEEGVFSESVNFAVTKKLPILFVCENNLFSTHTHIKYRQPDIPIYKRVNGLGVESIKLDGNDCFSVYRAASQFIRRLRNGEGPFFMECMTYRFREHVGPRYDFENPYRTKNDVLTWMKKCPIKNLETKMIKENILSVKKADGLKKVIRSQVRKNIKLARHAEWPKKEDLLKNVN